MRGETLKKFLFDVDVGCCMPHDHKHHDIHAHSLQRQVSLSQRSFCFVQLLRFRWAPD